MNHQDLKSAAEFIKMAVDAMEDGAVSPEEGIFLCQAGKGIFEKLEPMTNKRFVLFSIRAAISILDWLEHDLKDKTNG